MSSLRGVEVLQKELQRAQAKLKDVDENIKKLTGFDPLERSSRQGVQRRRVQEEQGDASVISPRGPVVSRRGRASLDGRVGGRLFNLARRDIEGDDDAPPAKRRAVGGAFSRLGDRVGSGARTREGDGEGRAFGMGSPPGRAFGEGRGRGFGAGRRLSGRLGGRRVTREPDSGDEEDETEKPALSSSVVPLAKDTKSREQVLEEQGKDSRGKARNRRMFGALLGTLARFKTEEKSIHSSKEKARQDIEKKLENRAREEKEELKRERRGLFEERRNKQQKLKQLESKMELVKIHEEWVEQTKILMNFIRTKARPCLFYLPKSHNTASKKKLLNSKELLDDVIEARRQAMEEELQALATADPEQDERQQAAQEQRDEEEEDDMEQDTTIEADAIIEDDDTRTEKDLAKIKVENETEREENETEPKENETESKQNMEYGEDHEELDYEGVENEDGENEDRKDEEEENKENHNYDQDKTDDRDIRVVQQDDGAKENDVSMDSKNKTGDTAEDPSSSHDHVEQVGDKRRFSESKEHRHREASSEDERKVRKERSKRKKEKKDKKEKRERRDSAKRRERETRQSDEDVVSETRQRRVEISRESEEKENTRTVVKKEDAQEDASQMEPLQMSDIPMPQ